MLSVHVDPNEILANAADHPVQKFHGDNRSTFHSYVRDGDVAIPKFTLPDQGVSSKVAYQVIHDELTLDGNPTLNLASFVHTWMPPDAEKLIMENIAKNAVDQDEYPATQAIHGRCISMLANLWNIPKGKKAIGTATAGSSEAIMLGGLALKKRWQEKRKAEGKDYFHPNIIFGANAQVALEKFARYFDVECRLVPVKEEHDFVMHPPDALQYIDENTIGIMVILGSTYNGAFEDVKLMSDLLDKHQAETGLDISIHVDAASGGFFAPFAYPDLKWAFDVPRVASINTSGHKFGLVYAGLGWVIWQDETLLPKEMVFELHYLGSVEYTFSLNFSKPAAPIIAQMFNFLNLGFQGYRDVAFKDLRNARLLARALEGTGYFKVLSPIHRESGKKDVEDHAPELYQRGLPVVSFRLSEKYQEEYPGVKQVWIQNLLRAKGWIVPNYGAPPAEEKTEMLRVVVRETMTHDLIEKLVVDLITVTESLMTTESDGGTLKMMEAIAGRPSKSHEHPDKKHTKPVHHRRHERRQSTFSQTC